MSAGLSNKVQKANGSRVAYIESEMAKRRLGQAAGRMTNNVSEMLLADEHNLPSSSRLQTLQRQPASMGKIHEIDLGRDTSVQNKQRTAMAIRRVRGADVPPEPSAETKKLRRGKNGKSRRGPKPRDAEDMKRDQLVEQVLHETRRK